jgi:uncharacterized lipoprotein YmbA
MTKSARTSLAILAVLAAALTLAGCANGQPTRFYTLSALADAPGGTLRANLPELTVGVGPVTLPPYLDRPQLVTRVGGNRMVLADFDSWVEPMPGMFARVLAENLALLLGTDDVLMLPQRRDFALDRQVEVDVTRFDVDAAGNAVLDARWWVYGRRREAAAQWPLHDQRAGYGRRLYLGCRRAQPRARRDERGNRPGDRRKDASIGPARRRAAQAGLYAIALISMRQSNMKSTRNTERTGWLTWKYSA